MLGKEAFERFVACHEKIFSDERIGFTGVRTMHSWHPEGSGQAEEVVANLMGLRQMVELGSQDATSMVILVSQGYSWGRLKVSSAAFWEIISMLGASEKLLNVLGSYGIKIHEDDQNRYGIWTIKPFDCGRDSSEMCYNIPFVQRHGRSLEDPWSLRQVGIYQQVLKGTQALRLIVVNPSSLSASTLKSCFEPINRCCRMRLHIDLLADHGCGWVDYVAYLRESLRTFDESACYSSMRQQKEHGFEITSEKLQDLHILQLKIERAVVAMKATMSITTTCRRLYDTETRQPFPVACRSCLYRLDSHLDEVREQLQSLRGVDHRLRHVLSLMSRMLLFRHQASLETSNIVSNNTLDILLAIAKQSRDQQEIFTRLLATVQSDSVLLKNLSIVATVYLPASLIATIFSSNLVQSAASETLSSVKSGLVLSPQFWIYIAISLPIMALTLLWTVYMDRTSRRKAVVTSAGTLNLSQKL